MDDSSELREVRRAAAAIKRATERLDAAALAALAAGKQQIDIAEAAGRSREWVRLLRDRHAQT